MDKQDKIIRQAIENEFVKHPPRNFKHNVMQQIDLQSKTEYQKDRSIFPAYIRWIGLVVFIGFVLIAVLWPSETSGLKLPVPDMKIPDIWSDISWSGDNVLLISIAFISLFLLLFVDRLLKRISQK